ncbi:hypothetical protein K1719_029751 [Acacia pycnantha]|nr:hypothetical protein K1719_029751 [Acacia pycnantha]
MHFHCVCDGSLNFLLSAVYAVRTVVQKRILWEELEQYASSISATWVVLGDFNDILLSSERSGGSACSDVRMGIFSDRINRCKMNDLVASGPKFTWKGPMMAGGRRLYERLDRALANEKLLLQILNYAVQVLPRSCFSDHNPLCLKVEGNICGSGDRCFRFEAMWLKHENYSEFL